MNDTQHTSTRELKSRLNLLSHRDISHRELVDGENNNNNAQFLPQPFTPQKSFEQIQQKSFDSDKDQIIDSQGNIQGSDFHIKKLNLDQDNETCDQDIYSFNNININVNGRQEHINHHSQNHNQSHFGRSSYSRSTTHVITKKKKISFVSIVLLYRFVSLFVKNLKFKYQDTIAIKSLTKAQIDRIGDITYEFVNPEQQRLQYLRDQKHSLCYYRTCLKIVTFFPIIQPNQIFKLLTDCWQSFLVLYRMFFTSVKLFFFIDNIQGSIGLISTSMLMVINISFIFDMFLSLHTGYYEKGVIVTDRRKIAKKYLTSTFISDILAQIPLFLAYNVHRDSNYNLQIISYILEFLIFLKLFSLFKVFHRLERVLTENEVMAAWWPLVKLIVLVVILAHCVALLYYGAAFIQIYFWDEKQTWYQSRGYVYQDWIDAYLHAVYWAFQTMVSNQLYEPTTRSDALYAVIAIMGLTGIFAYILNTIGMILEQFEKKSKKFKSEREMTNRFMKKRAIPPAIRERIALYLDYVHQQEKERNKEEEDKVLERLSDQLRDEVLMFINKKNVEMFNIINQTFTNEAKKKVMLQLREELYSPGEIIYRVNDTEFDQHGDGLSMYAVLKGTVELFQRGPSGDEFVVKKIQEGQVFGQIEFFTGQCRLESSRSSEACSVIRIERRSFLELIEQSQEDQELFCMIKDQLGTQYKSVHCDIKCYLCDKTGHLTTQCPTTNIKIDKKQLIFDYNNFDIQIQRGQYQRQQGKWHNALADMDVLTATVQQLERESEELYILRDQLEKTEPRRSFQKGQFGQQFTTSSQFQSQEQGLHSLGQIKEEDEESQEIEKSLVSPFEFPRRYSHVKNRRTSTLLKFAQGSDQINLQTPEDILTPTLDNHRNSKKIKGLSEKRNSLMPTDLDQLTMLQQLQLGSSISIERGPQGLQSTNPSTNMDFMAQSQVMRSKNKSKAKSNSNIIYLTNQRSPSIPIPQSPFANPVAYSFKQERELKREQEEKEKRMKQDQEEYDYIQQNFDKIKNWEFYWTEHNYDKIKFEKHVCKYFQQYHQKLETESPKSNHHWERSNNHNHNTFFRASTSKFFDKSVGIDNSHFFGMGGKNKDHSVQSITKSIIPSRNSKEEKRKSQEYQNALSPKKNIPSLVMSEKSTHIQSSILNHKLTKKTKQNNNNKDDTSIIEQNGIKHTNLSQQTESSKPRDVTDIYHTSQKHPSSPNHISNGVLQQFVNTDDDNQLLISNRNDKKNKLNTQN